MTLALFFDCRKPRFGAKFSRVSTVSEIEEAIGRLPVGEREALESRLVSRRFGLDALDDEERAELLASLDEADREIDEGGGRSPDEVRQALRSWIGR
jgi:hypothetical protein